MDHRPLQELRLRDFRCFHDQQTARLAPLTLLVGDNSTGKTSFLAGVRAILEVASFLREPDFRSAPYDLGSFHEIAYRPHNVRGAGAVSFSLGFGCAGDEAESLAIDATFALGDGAAPALATVEWSAGDVWFREYLRDPDARTELGCAGGSWSLPAPTGPTRPIYIYGGDIRSLARVLENATKNGVPGDLEPLHGGQTVPSKTDSEELIALFVDSARFRSGAFAGAPIRSNPLRTYHPVRLARDPQGFSMPAFLANAYSRDPERWQQIKQRLEEFGRASGMFDEIFVRRLGRYVFEPFQLEVRKWGKKRKGAKRNLIDVGYGVSQVLPLLVDLVNPDGSSLFLLQQPEIHLHPSAQAELGSLFCTSAASGRQLIVETHSDYIVDRILLDIRDKRTDLKPDDVSILFFEREDLEVAIHSISIDDEGNVLDAPEGYRKFFKDELNRVIDY